MTAASKGAKGQRERPDALSWELQQAWKADSPCPRGREKVVYHDLCHRRVSKDSHWPKTLAVSLFKDLFFPTIYFPNRVEKGYPQTETEKATQAHCCHPKPSLEYVSEPCISGDDSRLAALCWRATSDLLSSYSHTDVGGCLKQSSLGQGQLPWQAVVSPALVCTKQHKTCAGPVHFWGPYFWGQILVSEW